MNRLFDQMVSRYLKTMCSRKIEETITAYSGK